MSNLNLSDLTGEERVEKTETRSTRGGYQPEIRRSKVLKQNTVWVPHTNKTIKTTTFFGLNDFEFTPYPW
jgi:hypothetical protein